MWCSCLSVRIIVSCVYCEYVGQYMIPMYLPCPCAHVYLIVYMWICSCVCVYTYICMTLPRGMKYMHLGHMHICTNIIPFLISISLNWSHTCGLTFLMNPFDMAVPQNPRSFANITTSVVLAPSTWHVSLSQATHKHSCIVQTHV